MAFKIKDHIAGMMLDISTGQITLNIGQCQNSRLFTNETESEIRREREKKKKMEKREVKRRGKIKNAQEW